MTRLAVQDKNYGEKDRKINGYFKHDYVYKKNVWTRISAAVGCVIILALYWLYKILIDGIDVFTLNFNRELTWSLIIVVFFMLVYTLIGTIIASAEYTASEKRLKRYFNLIRRLDKLCEAAPPDAEEDSNLYYGSTFTAKRTNGKIL